LQLPHDLRGRRLDHADAAGRIGRRAGEREIVWTSTLSRRLPFEPE